MALSFYETHPEKVFCFFPDVVSGHLYMEADTAFVISVSQNYSKSSASLIECARPLREIFLL